MSFRSIILCAIGVSATAFGAAVPACARVGLVVGEPFGSFGTMLPVGHASVYLDHLCAETPTKLRPCHEGEYGVVVSRYHDLRTSQLDWMAVPALTFFYGVDDPVNVPAFVTPEVRDQLRLAYHDEYLRDVVPGALATRVDRYGNRVLTRSDDWQEAIGSAFDRRLLIYTFATTADQDAHILAFVNDLPMHRRYNLGRANCADFAADILRVALADEKPHILHRGILADFDITTPKAIARELDAYGETHPEMDFAVYEVPQIPGTLRRSRPLRGDAELFLKTKRYLFTLIVIQPEFVAADWLAYETKGRWKPGLDAIRVSPNQWPAVAASASQSNLEPAKNIVESNNSIFNSPTSE